MQLKDEFASGGNYLFRNRSYLPLVLLGLLFAGVWVGESPTRQSWGGGWETLCAAVSILGIVVRSYAVGYSAEGTSGRNTIKQKAHHLNTTGAYSMVRHPLYLGNFLIALGIFMFTEVWWAFILYALAFWLYYERIMFAEEAFLDESFGDEFRDWAERTPAFLPRFDRYEAPRLAFSWRKVLRREYSGMLAFAVSFTALEVLGGLRREGALRLDTVWSIVLPAALVCYLILRFLKKSTRVLTVEGR